LDAIRAYGEAEIHAVERYQGADVANDAYYMQLQAAAVAENGRGLAAGMRAVAVQLAEFADRLEAAGATHTLSQADYDAAIAFRDRMAGTGLTQAERDQFTAEGIPDAEINAAQARFATQPLPADAVGKSLTTATRELATKLEAEAAQQEAFAQTFASSLTRPEAATLKAVITAKSGHEQLAPAVMRLSAEDSVAGGNEIVSFHWDFDDGATDDGVQTTHVFATPGTHTATLTVTDSTGATATDQVTVSAITRSQLELPMCVENGTLEMRCPGFEALPPGGALTVAGSGPVDVGVTHRAHFGAWSNGLVWFTVDDPLGTIDGAAPGSPGWWPAALSRMKVAFGPGGVQTDQNQVPLTAQIPAQGGDHIAFALVANGTSTVSDIAMTNPFNEQNRSPILNHLFTAANPFRVVQALPYLRTSDGMVQIGFEDQPGNADDFNDDVYDIAGVRADPLGDLAATIAADDPEILTEEEDAYQATVRNAGSGDVVLESISVTLPEGFSYVAGSSRGATTADPVVDGRTLRWTGRVIVPEGGRAGVHLRVTAGKTAGRFLASTTADARGVPLTPSGAGAPIVVSARPAVPPEPTPAPPAPPAPVAPTATPSAPPLVVPDTAASVIKLPSNKRCVSRRRFRIRLVEPKAGKLVSATVTINGKQVKAVRGKRLTAPVDLKGLPKGRFVIRITARTSTGQALVTKRRYRTCVPKRRS
jgi:PKD repeat protein